MKDLTQGSVLRQLLNLSAFMLIGMLVQTLYAIIDMFWAGRLGPEAVAAVTTSSIAMMIAFAATNMLSTGTNALVAQAVGRRDYSAAHYWFNQALGLGIVMMLVTEFIGVLLEGAYARAFAADAETARQTVAFLYWFVPAMGLQFPIAAAGSALRGTGNIRPGTIMQISTVVLNMILAPVLIFGWYSPLPPMGVAGGALATLLASLAGALGLMAYFSRSRTFLRVNLRDWRPVLSECWSIVKIGLPSAAEVALMSIYMLFVTAVLKPFGAVEQAAFGIGQRMMQTGMMPAMAISFAASAVAGQNYGARLPERVRATFGATLKLTLSMTGTAALIGLSFPHALMSVFTSDPAVIAGGVDYLGILSFNLLAVAIAMSCFGVLSGLGNTMPTLISSAARITIIIAPVSWLTTVPGFRPMWLWEMSLCGTVAQVVLNFYFLRRELDRKLGARAPAIVPGVEPAE